MKKLLPALLLSAFLATSATAQDWSLGVRTGAFVFGDFVERTLRAGNTTPGETQTVTLSAATKAGLAVDLEKSFNDRWAIRAAGTWTRAPLAVKGESEDETFELEAGDLDVTTFSVPLVFRINRNGNVRFYAMAGPAYAAYHTDTEENALNEVPVFEGTRGEWGLTVGGGLVWRWSDRFGLEAAIADTVTGSPFKRTDFPDVPGIDLKRPHNVHTTVGLRWAF
jgi:opacity protein-like surface antigen